ncbi:hypothetical protein ADUPG1_006806 [Aduncisulcus paluster]|uniref:Calcineurin-like phosphoesterase domain-containing protein n=1 Tax=Aduncisulcus paluster TaxID=2918883 RepID=A0ABQ5KMM0_9EUKA|nr:hypothetical protein ADUPG1_006806 [Aduncisulcus paluster]
MKPTGRLFFFLGILLLPVLIPFTTYLVSYLLPRSSPATVIPDTTIVPFNTAKLESGTSTFLASPFWFIQETDMHLSIKHSHYNNDILQGTMNINNIIHPSLFLFSGDITDGLINLFTRHQIQAEFDIYSQFLELNGIASPIHCIDISGNHDCINLASHAPEHNIFAQVSPVMQYKEAYPTLLSANVLSGASFENSILRFIDDKSYAMEIGEGKERLIFLVSNIVIDPGLTIPFNYVGVVNRQMLDHLEEYIRSLDNNYTSLITVSHQCLNVTLSSKSSNGESYFEFVRKYSTLHLCGHDHKSGMFHRLSGKRAVPELQCPSPKRGDYLLRPFIFDEGRVVFFDIPLDKCLHPHLSSSFLLSNFSTDVTNSNISEPLRTEFTSQAHVVVTNPIDARVAFPERSVSREWMDVRVMVFDMLKRTNGVTETPAPTVTVRVFPVSCGRKQSACVFDAANMIDTFTLDEMVVLSHDCSDFSSEIVNCEQMSWSQVPFDDETAPSEWVSWQGRLTRDSYEEIRERESFKLYFKDKGEDEQFLVLLVEVASIFGSKSQTAVLTHQNPYRISQRTGTLEGMNMASLAEDTDTISFTSIDVEPGNAARLDTLDVWMLRTLSICGFIQVVIVILFPFTPTKYTFVKNRKKGLAWLDGIQAAGKDTAPVSKKDRSSQYLLHDQSCSLFSSSASFAGTQPPSTRLQRSSVGDQQILSSGGKREKEKTEKEGRDRKHAVEDEREREDTLSPSKLVLSSQTEDLSEDGEREAIKQQEEMRVFEILHKTRVMGYPETIQTAEELSQASGEAKDNLQIQVREMKDSLSRIRFFRNSFVYDTDKPQIGWRNTLTFYKLFALFCLVIPPFIGHFAGDSLCIVFIYGVLTAGYDFIPDPVSYTMIMIILFPIVLPIVLTFYGRRVCCEGRDALQWFKTYRPGGLIGYNTLKIILRKEKQMKTGRDALQWFKTYRPGGLIGYNTLKIILRKEKQMKTVSKDNQNLSHSSSKEALIKRPYQTDSARADPQREGGSRKEKITLEESESVVSPADITPSSHARIASSSLRKEVKDVETRQGKGSMKEREDKKDFDFELNAWKNLYFGKNLTLAVAIFSFLLFFTYNALLGLMWGWESLFFSPAPLYCGIVCQVYNMMCVHKVLSVVRKISST